MNCDHPNHADFVRGLGSCPLCGGSLEYGGLDQGPRIPFVHDVAMNPETPPAKPPHVEPWAQRRARLIRNMTDFTKSYGEAVDEAHQAGVTAGKEQSKEGKR